MRHAYERRLVDVQIDKNNQEVEKSDDTIEKDRKKEKNMSKEKQYLSDDRATRCRNNYIWYKREEDVNTFFKKKVENSN